MGSVSSHRASLWGPEGERFGAYRLLERLDQGGMGEVFRARLERGPEPSRMVAVKRVLVDPADQAELRARFLEEARVVASLQHPNLVQVIDYGEVDERPYLATELVDGVDLWRLIELSRASGRPMEPAAAVYLIAEAACGLGYANAAEHEGRIVHRDVSPQHILISRLGEVKVDGFGIAKATKGPFDARSDVFALGVLLHELLTSVPLIDAVSAAGGIQQAACFDPPSSLNPYIPPLLDEITMRALAPDPAKRYPHAKDLAAALGVLLNQLRPGYGPEELSEFVVGQLTDASGAAT